MKSPTSHFIIRYSASDWVSVLGLCFACLALWLTIDTREATYTALALITAAMLCDALDGWVARKTQITRPFGAYFDTNIDILTHLLAPLIWFWHWGFDAPWQLLILLLVLICGMTRLAVFNEKGFVQDESGNAYWGTPVFWCPIWIACFVLLAGIFTQPVVEVMATLVLPLFAWSMLRPHSAYKPKSIARITLLLSIAIIVILCWERIPAAVWQHLQLTFLMTLPLWVASHFNLLFSKMAWLKRLNRPMYQSAFGQNKTWRGTLCLVVGTALSCTLMPLVNWGAVLHHVMLDFSTQHTWLLGACLGAAFIIGELPNSYIKRRLNIAPGSLPKASKLWVIIGDQIDSAWLVIIVYAVFFGFSWGTIGILLVSLPLTFFFFRIYFFVIGLKASPLR